jgi:hypothetical protein
VANNIKLPVSDYCNALETWGRIAVARGIIGRGAHHDVQLGITKSSLLARVIYGGEGLRTERCPIHEGRWSGLEWTDNACPHGCQLTGWLPQPQIPLIPGNLTEEMLRSFEVDRERDRRIDELDMRLAERATNALLRIVSQPWSISDTIGGRTGNERTKGGATSCPGCGFSWGHPDEGLHLDPGFHCNVATLCPWLLAAQTLLGMEVRT